MTTSPVIGITEEILSEIERAGWKLVPVESTVKMEYSGCKAASRVMWLGEAGRVYSAMLAAAPEYAAQRGGVGRAMSDKTELLPCPFCGGTNLVKSPWIECDNCGAMGPSPRDCDNYSGEWNRRPSLAQQPAAVVQEPVACCPYCGGTSGHCDPSFPHPREQAKAPPAAEQSVMAMHATPAAPVVHTDDAAVDRFATRMKAKLAAARAKGRGGWDDPAQCSVESLAALLVEHLRKGNAGTFEDVANFSMMLHQRGADPRVLADAAAPAAQEPMPRASLIDLMRDAENIVRQKHVWKKFINGTPLNNDIPVWMAEFALQLLDSAPPAAEQPFPSGCPCNTLPGPCENCGPAEQPATVAVPRELLGEAESIIESYAEALKASHAPGGDWEGEEAAQDDYEREAGVALKLRRLLAGGAE